jgi:hypothetical protein
MKINPKNFRVQESDEVNFREWPTTILRTFRKGNSGSST